MEGLPGQSQWQREPLGPVCRPPPHPVQNSPGDAGGQRPAGPAGKGGGREVRSGRREGGQGGGSPLCGPSLCEEMLPFWLPSTQVSAPQSSRHANHGNAGGAPSALPACICADLSWGAAFTPKLPLLLSAHWGRSKARKQLSCCSRSSGTKGSLCPAGTAPAPSLLSSPSLICLLPLPLHCPLGRRASQPLSTPLGPSEGWGWVQGAGSLHSWDCPSPHGTQGLLAWLTCPLTGSTGHAHAAGHTAAPTSPALRHMGVLGTYPKGLLMHSTRAPLNLDKSGGSSTYAPHHYLHCARSFLEISPHCLVPQKCGPCGTAATITAPESPEGTFSRWTPGCSTPHSSWLQDTVPHSRHLSRACPADRCLPHWTVTNPSFHMSM